MYVCIGMSVLTFMMSFTTLFVHENRTMMGKSAMEGVWSFNLLKLRKALSAVLLNKSSNSDNNNDNYYAIRSAQLNSQIAHTRSYPHLYANLPLITIIISNSFIRSRFASKCLPIYDLLTVCFQLPFHQCINIGVYFIFSTSEIHILNWFRLQSIDSFPCECVVLCFFTEMSIATILKLFENEYFSSKTKLIW